MAKVRKYKGHIDKDLEIIYDSIVDRFSLGSMAARMIRRKNFSITDVESDLTLILFGNDSDKKYTDKKSKSDAKKFIARLKEYEKNKS